MVEGKCAAMLSLLGFAWLSSLVYNTSGTLVVEMVRASVVEAKVGVCLVWCSAVELSWLIVEFRGQ